MNKLYTEATEIILAVKKHIKPDTNVVWTTYKSVEELIDILDKYIERLKKEDLTVMDEINIAFLPTSNFCELAISNGWGDDYLILAEKFDTVYKTHNSLIYRLFRKFFN